MYKQLKQSEVQLTREDILEKQHGRCAICNNPITDSSGYALDHQHKTSKETIGEDGAGLIRGVLCRPCNVLEGRIWNNMQRYIQPETVKDRINWLQSLISYYNKGTYQFVHPSESPKEPSVSKRNYNTLKRIYNGTKKFPEYPKSGKLTKPLELLFNEYNVSPYN